MSKKMAKLPKAAGGSLVGRSVGAFMRFGVLRGLRSVEIKPETFRKQLADKHGLWVPDFTRMRDVPIERLDAIAKILIRDAERLAAAEGAGFGLGGVITLLPDTSFLTLITLRLIQRLSLLYGFDTSARGERIEMWKAAAAAAGIDYGKDFAEKQILEKLIPRIVQRLAVKIGVESAEKWAARLIPLASSAVGGTMNFVFVRGWGRRVQRHLRARHVGARPLGSGGASAGPQALHHPILVS
jgi:EcsC protein family